MINLLPHELTKFGRPCVYKTLWKKAVELELEKQAVFSCFLKSRCVGGVRFLQDCDGLKPSRSAED